jgi:hypothetical protein
MSDDDSQPREADLAFADTYSDTDDSDQDSIPGDTPGAEPMRRESIYTGQPVETIRLVAYLFCANANISRTSYSRLREMLSLLKQANVAIEPTDGYDKARVLAVQADMRPTSTFYGEIVITCQPVVKGED